jgi:drug/metabolite transporter superfamily protein YnfA
MNLTLLALVVAAVLEISGDALIRTGLVGAKWYLVVGGGAVLVAYGLVVNTNRAIDFGRLMGVYIAVFFVVSQIVAYLTFGSRPSARALLAGALIVAGGLLFQLGTD